jgi:protein-tyrosine-phosphatase
MRQGKHKTVLFLCTGNYYRSRFAEGPVHLGFREDGAVVKCVVQGIGSGTGRQQRRSDGGVGGSDS